MFLRDDGNARSTESRNSRMTIGRKGLFSGLLAIVGLTAVLAVAAPATAMSINQLTGRPGFFVSNDGWNLHNCENIYLDQHYQATLSTGSMIIGPSPFYAPSNQAIARYTYFQYS